MRPDPTGGMSHEIYGSFVTIARTYASAREFIANARLIAAAPELLAVCRALCENVDTGEFSIKCLDGEWKTANLDHMRKVIAKAEGASLPGTEGKK